MGAGVFITSTGTDAGKSFVARGLASALRLAGVRVVALKPFETGCEPAPADAIALANAAGVDSFIEDPAFYRARLPAAPFAAAIHGEPAADFERVAQRVRRISTEFAFTIVEGAGGLLVPIDDRRDIADLAAALAYPLLLVAPNRLGVLSHVRAAFESATARKLPIAAIVLTEVDSKPDASHSTNARILEQRLGCLVLGFPHCPNDDRALATAAGELARHLRGS
jgi:dethiobiotin synthetase